MKALCFTFDRNMLIMEYVLHTYFKCWPDNPFVFYIPWNNIQPEHLIQQYGADKIKLLKTDSAVKPTIRTLLSVVDKNEFVWWAQDDKYILDFKDKQMIEDLYKFDSKDIGGFMFTKNADAHKSFLKTKHNFGAYELVKKRNHHQIFQPQWIKKEVIQFLYLNNRLPEHYPLLELYPIMNFKPIKDLYSVQQNYINIAESLDQGKLTSNLVYHMNEDNFKIPDLPRCNKTMIYKD